MKKIACFLAAVLLFLIFPVQAFAIIPGQEFATTDSRLQSVFEYHLSTMENSASLSIARTKKAVDFIGNEYTVIECAPTGYMIYDNSNGIFTEYSSSATSPYLGMTGTIYYCGPANYFVLNAKDGRVEHTIQTDTWIALENMDNYSSACIEYREAYDSIANPVVLNYVKNGNPSQPFAEIAERNAVINSTASSSSWEYIYHGEFFENLTRPGYTSGGICGYIALGMVLAYQDNKNDNFLDDSFWANTSKTALKECIVDDDSQEDSCISCSIGHYLYKNHSDNAESGGITAIGIGLVAQRYFTKRNESVDPDFVYSDLVRTVPTFTQFTIVSQLDQDNPVILCGNFYDADRGSNINHCVVAYAYRGGITNREYKVHFGWNDRSEIVLNGVIGSIYALCTE